MKSRDSRIPFLRIDPERLDRLPHDHDIQLAILRKRGQRRDDHVAVVDFEEVPQRGPVVAPAEAVGPERRQRRGSQRSIESGSALT